ncbi:MAG TPA: AMP-binding protein [Gemmatimonadaceae bacterium]|nr:AMP-binding protein [Gemmatimonadaceae bacterium]
MSCPLFPARPDVVSWWARVHPRKLALVDRARGQRLTYGELDAASERMAHTLLALGVKRGDRVATLAGSRAEQLTVFGGCLRLGAILVPLNWRLAAPELARVLADATPSVVFGEGRFRATAEEAQRLGAPIPRWVDLDSELSIVERRAGAPAGFSHVRAEPELPTMLLYTSGSTGQPKGAILPHRQLFYNALATTSGWGIGIDDVAPVHTPFFHTGAWHVVAMPHFHVGAAIVLFEQFEPRAFLEGLVEERCTWTFGVPTQIAMMLECPGWERALGGLRFFMSGGAPCPPALQARLRAAGVTFREGFGMTEFGPNTFAISDEEAVAKPGFVGHPMPFVEMRLRGDDGAEPPTGDPGELQLRGPQMFAGYWNAAEKTAQCVDAEGWLHTGDLASRDADGAYRIRGRKKDMYISGGENVFPGEVEAALAECDGVVEAVVVAVPDAKWGEVGRAYVVPRGGRTLGEMELIAHVRAKLAGYKAPKSVAFLDALPRLGSGKIDRAALAARAQREVAGG